MENCEMSPNTKTTIINARVNSLGQVLMAPCSLCLNCFLIQCFLYHIRAVYGVFVVDCTLFHSVVSCKNNHRFLPAPCLHLLQCDFCRSSYQRIGLIIQSWNGWPHDLFWPMEQWQTWCKLRLENHLCIEGLSLGCLGNPAAMETRQS